MPTALSLFAGCGGDTLGLEQAGFNVAGFVEWLKPAIESHLANFPNSRHLGAEWEGDITQIPDDVFAAYRGKVDLIFAGFPCQGFSHAGKKDANDPRNKLFWEFVRATQLIQPRWVVGENVSGLLRRRTDDGTTPVSSVIARAFTGIGYTMADPFVLNALEFGVPQKRNRVFFVGSRDGLRYQPPAATHSKKPAPGLARPAPIRGALAFTLQGAAAFDPSAVHGGVPTFLEAASQERPTGRPHPYLLAKLGEGLVSYGKRISPLHVEVADLDAPAKTIHSGYSFQPRLFVPLRNRRGTFLRAFTSHELQQLQGFPADFRLAGSEAQRIAQVGNAVPPALAAAVARQALAADPGLARPRARRSAPLARARSAPRPARRSNRRA